MTRPRLVDTVLFHDELDMLECRLVEIGDLVDYVVIVEADVTFRGEPKPLWFAEHRDRFHHWADRIVHLVIDDLPGLDVEPDPWVREDAQRDRTLRALADLDLAAHDIVLHGDVDEIPRRFHLRNVRPAGNMVVFGMRMHCFAVDWQHPVMWQGTVAATIRTLASLPNANRFAYQRDNRLRTQCPPHLRDAVPLYRWVRSSSQHQVHG